MASAHEVVHVTPVAAAGVEDAHTGCDPAARDLIEQVDVDIAELRAERWLDALIVWMIQWPLGDVWLRANATTAPCGAAVSQSRRYRLTRIR
jgi:hypothetical protein